MPFAGSVPCPLALPSETLRRAHDIVKRIYDHNVGAINNKGLNVVSLIFGGGSESAQRTFERLKRSLVQNRQQQEQQQQVNEEKSSA